MCATLTGFDSPPVGSHLHEIGPLKGGRNDVNHRLMLGFFTARGGGVVGVKKRAPAAPSARRGRGERWARLPLVVRALRGVGAGIVGVIDPNGGDVGGAEGADGVIRSEGG